MDNPLKEVLSDLKSEMLRRSEDVQPWHSYWYHRPTRNFPPPTIRHPQDFDGFDRLSLACTQTDLPQSTQRKLIQSWCELLPRLSSIKVLWFHSKVTQELFNAACQMPQLEGLYIKWSGITSLDPISSLKELKYLHIGSSPSAQPLSSISGLPSIVDLEIENIRESSDLSFLEGMPQLKSLSISGDGNSIKSIKLKTLGPLKFLRNLERLSLSTVTVDDESLEPIACLPKIKYLLLSNQFEMEEVAALSGNLPHVSCDLFNPVGEPATWTTCKSCSGKSMVMLTGKRKPWLCTVCDASRIEHHREAFRQIAGRKK